MVARSVGELLGERAHYEAQMIYRVLLNRGVLVDETRPGSGSGVEFSDDEEDWVELPANYYQRRVVSAAGAGSGGAGEVARAVTFEDYLWLPHDTVVALGDRIESIEMDDAAGAVERLQGDYATVVGARWVETHLEVELEVVNAYHR